MPCCASLWPRLSLASTDWRTGTSQTLLQPPCTSCWIAYVLLQLWSASLSPQRWQPADCALTSSSNVSQMWTGPVELSCWVWNTMHTVRHPQLMAGRASVPVTHPPVLSLLSTTSFILFGQVKARLSLQRCHEVCLAYLFFQCVVNTQLDKVVAAPCTTAKQQGQSASQSHSNLMPCAPHCVSGKWLCVGIPCPSLICTAKGPV